MTSQSKNKRDPRSYVRPRVPLAYAGLLIVALVAVIGFAAFSPSTGSVEDSVTASTIALEPTAPAVSARVASAVLALRVSDAESRTATTQASAGTTTTSDSPDTTLGEASDEAFDTESSTTSVDEVAIAPSTTAEPTTTAAPKPTTARDTTPPPIKVTSPKDGATVKNRTVTFEGTTEKGAKVTSGPYSATVKSDGTWTLKLVVAEGANGASFTATDAAGNTASKRIVVHYESASTTTTTKAKTKTTTTTHAETTTTSGSSTSKWSPNWPADGGGMRNVEEWRPLVEKYWAADRVDCVLGIIYKESRGDPRAFNSRTNAEGLMQHLSKYWKNRAASAGFRDSNGLYATPYNAEANIAAGAQIAGSGSNWWVPWGFLPTYGSCTGS